MRRRRREIESRAVSRAALVLLAAAFHVAASWSQEPRPAAEETQPVAEEPRPAALEPQPAAGGDLLDRFLDEVVTLEAGFEQELWAADERLLQFQSGLLALARPGRFRWEYREPNEQLVVADGENLWMYDVELEQVTVTPLDDTIASTPAMLLSGDHAVRDGFTVVGAFEQDGLSWLRLEPDIEGTDFRSVLLGFEGLSPRRLELVDGFNQTTRIELFDVMLNPELDDELFQFDPPPNAHVLGTPAP